MLEHSPAHPTQPWGLCGVYISERLLPLGAQACSLSVSCTGGTGTVLSGYCSGGELHVAVAILQALQQPHTPLCRNQPCASSCTGATGHMKAAQQCAVLLLC